MLRTPAKDAPGSAARSRAGRARRASGRRRRFVLGCVTFYLGAPKEALESLRSGAELARSSGDTQTLALSLGQSAWVLAELGKRDEALGSAEECLELIEALSGWARGAALSCVGAARTSSGDLAGAEPLSTEALRLSRATGDELSIASTLNNLGYLALLQGTYSEAGAYLEESLAITRRLNDRFRIALVLGNLGILAVLEGRSEEAVATLTEELRLSSARGDRRLACEAILGLASAHAALGNPQLAVKLHAAQRTLEEATGLVGSWGPGQAERLERSILRARAELDPAVVAALTEQGSAMTPEAVLAELEELE